MPISYVDAVERAGGLPLIVPPYGEPDLFKAVLPALDGFCLVGGDDYAPHHYGGRIQRAEEQTSERRTRFDWALAKHLLDETHLPVLGICGGQQLLGLVRGAGLVQDIRTEWQDLSGRTPLPHASRDRGKAVYDPGYAHALRVQPESLLAGVTGATSGVWSCNSYHHQSIRPERVGADLVATAWADDGMVEALEPVPGSALAKNGRFILGVQWHPERMTNDASHQALFEALVQAAGRARG